MKTARQTAFEILIKINRDNAFSNLAIDAKLNNCELNAKDKSLATAIVYGVLERRLTLDYVASLYLKQSINKLKPEVLTALRIGVFQLLFMNKIPNSAAINESVQLVKKNGCTYASGLLNAVLRKVCENGLSVPDYDKDKLLYYSIKYSCPTQLVAMWLKAYGEENTKQILAESIGPAPTVIRVNTLKTNSQDLIKILAEHGVTAKICNEVEDALILDRAGSVESILAYKNGLFHVQDTASQICCKALDVSYGQTVFDMCAAPGGKSFTLAQKMKNQGKLFSFDLYESRIKLIEEGAQRLGITNLTSNLLDASVYNENIGMADKVLCDVPCSGLGIIRRKPEIRYKALENIDKLPNIQYHILQTSAKYVNQGGTLLYSTCALNPKENDEVCDRFLQEHKNFKLVRPMTGINAYNAESNYLTLMPHINNSDGFFIATFIRTE
ncbi:MAG: 16S rRNA (cytosine(967)-C(5))-methyltransferase RsmB [Oscillospiraceae bacterium]